MEENKQQERPRVMFVCYYESTGEIITRAFVHSMEELGGLLAAFHRYYHARGTITEDFEKWSEDVVFEQEKLWQPRSFWQKCFGCCARKKIKHE